LLRHWECRGLWGCILEHTFRKVADEALKAEIALSGSDAEDTAASLSYFLEENLIRFEQKSKSCIPKSIRSPTAMSVWIT